MKKFAQFFFALLLVFIGVNFLYLFLLPRIDFEFKKTKEARQFSNQDLKVLVFGNSTALDGINAKILTDKFGAAYNFSLGGASLQTNFIQFVKYLEANSKPQKVLLFLSSTHTNYINANDINPMVQYYYEPVYNLRSLNDIPLFKFRWLFVENIKKIIPFINRPAEVIQGQLSIKSIVPDNTVLPNTSPSCYDNNFYNSSGYRYMWMMAKICKEKKIEIEVFEMPCWKDLQNNCPDVFVNNANYQLGFKIHNLNNHFLNDTMLDAKKDWLSRNHLNLYGSIKVTNKVVSILTK